MLDQLCTHRSSLRVYVSIFFHHFYNGKQLVTSCLLPWSKPFQTKRQMSHPGCLVLCILVLLLFDHLCPYYSTFKFTFMSTLSLPWMSKPIKAVDNLLYLVISFDGCITPVSPPSSVSLFFHSFHKGKQFFVYSHIITSYVILKFIKTGTYCLTEKKSQYYNMKLTKDYLWCM